MIPSARRFPRLLETGVLNRALAVVTAALLVIDAYVHLNDAVLYVFYYTYVDVGALGALPNMYEPTWALPGKRLAAVAEAAATVTAALGLAVVVHARRRHRGRSPGTRRIHRGVPDAKGRRPAQR
jgi:hypothetical protein